ncbi:alpha/beta hydrolase [Sunxiuqinia indica]|uniref:alpha/beta hydrolase n=1 Tax=Sunxiuqinia indica TaxID=2692584 RepID=UPI00135A49CC|nr:alpha/beta hydrolase [Sunxiuqinia indica]
MKIKLIIILLAVSSCLFAQKKEFPEIPRDTSFNVNSSYAKYKKYFPEIRPANPELSENVAAHFNLGYTTLPDTPFGKRDLHVDLFHPKKEGKYPALILVHGGGWRSGDKSLQVPMAKAIAEQGFVTVAVEYQLSLEAKYPAAIHNIKAAIRWMRANADKYHIDSDRIAISGCSAGGQLASLVGLTNDVEKFEGKQGYSEYSSSVQAIIDIDGVINFMAPLSLNNERRPDSPDVEWLEGDFYSRPDRWKEASPIYWANENSVPMLFLNSGFPRFTAGEYELISMLDRWGIENELHKFDVQLHPFWLFHPWFEPTGDYMVTFLHKVL